MPLNIAIDGPVGAGKSSVSKEVAKKLNILHLDTGAMYRALGYAAIINNIAPDDEQAAEALCDKINITVKYTQMGQATYVNGEDVTGKIRTPEISMAASTISKWQGVRKKMVALQQSLAKEQPMLLDGRDIGTRVLPSATIKIYLTASPEKRAMRRYLELQENGKEASYEQVLSDLNARDYQDMNREIDPLRPAEDAIVLDTSELTQEEVIAKVIELVEARYDRNSK